jgi:hypothetical protein
VEQSSGKPRQSRERADDEGVADKVAEQAGPGRARGVSRRVFIRTGSLGAAAVAFVGSVPGLSGLVTGVTSDSQQLPAAAGEVDGVAASGVASAVDGPVIAHVTDAASGDVSIYVGEREIVTRDPTLVAHLLRAAH